MPTTDTGPIVARQARRRRAPWDHNTEQADGHAPHRSPRRRGRVWLALAAVVVVAVGGIVARRVTEAVTPTRPASTTLPTRTIAAGAVTIKVSPGQLDTDGAVFKVSFDTHSVNLDQDLARQARLTVGANTWPVAGWSGDGPGGHHRSGELRFNAAGPAAGTVTLAIDGLPEPVTATWDLAS